MVRYRSFVQDSARWEGFAFREGDIVISTPPKCGTTWMQMICALLVLQSPSLPRPLDELSPWLDMLTNDRDRLVASLETQRHRRFIKSHTPLDGLPYDERVTYLVVGRDPRDAGFSWENHMDNMDLAALLRAREAAVGLEDLAGLPGGGAPRQLPTDPVDRFRWWVQDRTAVTETGSSLAYTLHHLATFWEQRELPNVLLFHYGDLQADLSGEMRRLASALNIDVPGNRWAELVEAATFDRMRARASELVPVSTHRIWHDDQRFFHKGATGQWRDLLTAEDLQLYAARVGELASTELAEWVHHGHGL